MYLPVVTKRNTPMFSTWCQSKLQTAFVLNCPEMLSSNLITGRILPNYKTLILSTCTVMELYDIFSRCPVCTKYKRDLNLQCNICLCLFVLPCNFQHSITLTTNVSDNNKQYLLHFSAAVVITKCSGLLF